jgi:hypothetical protein
MLKLTCLTAALFALTLSFAQFSYSQTNAFTYQGKLTDSSIAATGDYDMQFRLFDAGGTQVGATIRYDPVYVSNGVFTVQLNQSGEFGAAAFTGADRYLEVSVRRAGGPTYTALSPRTKITSVPFAIQAVKATTAGSAGSLSAACVLCVTGEHIASIGANKITGVLTATQGGTGIGPGFAPPDLYLRSTGTGWTFSSIPASDIPIGSPNYVQSNPATQQSGVNFNISGTGNANIFNALTQYNIGGIRVLAVTSGGLSPGPSNVFVGFNAGNGNYGSWNSFFGVSAGLNHTGGSRNSFFGQGAGRNNEIGGNNSFFGNDVGYSNQSGSWNSFFGATAGLNNTTGTSNTAIGYFANFSANNLTNATVIGANAVVSQSNSMVLGNDVNVGIGTTAPSNKLQIIDSSNTGLRVQNNTAGGTVASFGGNGIFYIDGGFFGPATVGGRITILENGNVGINDNNPVNRLSVAGTILASETISVGALGSAGLLQLCRNGTGQISGCSSSIRYKRNLSTFSSGLSLIKQLRPVSFNWRANDQADLGLVAEEVAKVEPLLTTTNTKGEIEGVKYDRVAVVLINAVNEQQAEIKAEREKNRRQQDQIELQQRQIDALKKLVCLQNTQPDICKEN